MSTPNPLVAAFLAEHPEYGPGGTGPEPEPGDPDPDPEADVRDAVAAFIRWCYARGHVNTVQMIALVNEFVLPPLDPDPPPDPRCRPRRPGSGGPY